MKVLIILGHPRKRSFSGALADAYREGATNAKMHVRQLDLADLNFNLHITGFSPRQQLLEEDISHARELILWADHMVFIYPTWWGSMPALLKGFLDRAFAPGFAFKEVEENKSWEKLLTGKTAQLITTMDTPIWVYRWIYKNPGHNALGKATLKFCGINPVRTLSFGPIKYSSAQQRQRWLEITKKKGFQLGKGILQPWEKVRDKTAVWLSAIRLQFYPMTWIAYTAGALGAGNLGFSFNSFVFWLGYLWLFLVEVATVVSNDYFDFESDRHNKNHSPFTGGSRVIVEKKLTHQQVLKGLAAAIVLSLVAAGLLLNTLSATNQTWGLMIVLFTLALGYTVPPLKLSYRGFGELDVAITHSFGVILCGYHFQGGNLFDPFPWLLGLPLFFGIFPSIILAGIPDYEADKKASKNTITVRMGKKKAVIVAVIFTALSSATVLFWHLTEMLPGAFGTMTYAIVIHGIVLAFFLLRYLGQTSPARRIDGLMILALTYVIWFGIIPLFNFLGG